MTTMVQALAERVVGTVEEVKPAQISVLIEATAPQATALNTGSPTGFPRLNGYVLIPNEAGATVGMISTVRIERLPFPKRKGMQDFGLLDLPFPARFMDITPIGTLTAQEAEGDLRFEVRRGVDVFPSVGDPVLIPTAGQLQAIVEGEGSATPGRILLGRSPTAGRAPVYADPDKLFGRHLAVLGNTGAGKSCSVAGLLRWSMEAAMKAREEDGKSASMPNARFIILDPNGEYARAFEDFKFRLFQVEAQPGGRAQQLKVPAWLWNGEEWAAFSEAAPGVQRPILFEAICYLRSGAEPPGSFEAKVRNWLRRLKPLGDFMSGGVHLQPGKLENVAQILLGIASYGRTLRAECAEPELREVLERVSTQAAVIEESARAYTDYVGKQRHNALSDPALIELGKLLKETAAKVGLPEVEDRLGEDIPSFFEVANLPGFVQALAAGSTRDQVQLVDSLNLRIRSLLKRGRLGSVLRPEDSADITLDQWLTDHIGADEAENGPLAIIDLSLVPSEVIHVIVASLGRLIFEALQRYRREKGQELPTVLVLEEAHTFIHRELGSEQSTPAGRVCRRVFERIAREGRKFGLGLVLASQRPSEMSETVLSQCNTFLLHRIVNDRDQELVRRLVPDAISGLLRELPSLPTRRAILLGWAAPAPILVEMQELPADSRPQSPDPAFWDVWTGSAEREIDWESIAAAWTQADAGEEEQSQDSPDY